jgi:hypothetical protein
MAEDATITTRVHFSPAPAGHARFPLPLAQPIGTGWIPVIYRPDRAAEYLRFERFIRKTKATGEEACAYAAQVIWHRQRRAAEKRRRLEALSHPRYEQTGRAA